MTRLQIFVPVAPELRERIWDGSGIVGSTVKDTGRLRLDFEGDEDTYSTFEERVRRAAERHLWEGPGGKKGYPSSAVAYADPGAVKQVGWWDDRDGSVEVTDPALLAKWLDPDETNGR